MPINIIEKGDLNQNSFVNDDTRNQEGIEINISTDEGNAIELRDNGLYYGNIAPASVARLHIDSENGDDNQTVVGGNPVGTRANPLKTIARAMELVDSDKSSTFLLKCADSAGNPMDHHLTRDMLITNSAVRTIIPYDDPYLDGSIAACYAANNRQLTGYFSNEMIRPNLISDWKLIPYGGQTIQSLAKVGTTAGGKIDMRGINWILPDQTSAAASPRASDRSATYGDVNIAFSGAAIMDQCLAVDAYLIRNASRITLRFISTRFQHNNGFINFSGASGEVVIVGVQASTGAAPACDPVTSYEPNTTNMEAQLTAPGAITNIARDSSGRPLNVLSNFEL